MGLVGGVLAVAFNTEISKSTLLGLSLSLITILVFPNSFALIVISSSLNSATATSGLVEVFSKLPELSIKSNLALCPLNKA